MAFPTTGVLDNFAYSNGELSTRPGTRWSAPLSTSYSWNVSSGVVYPISAGGAICLDTTLGDILPAEAYVTIPNLPSSGQSVGLGWFDASGNGYVMAYVHGSPGSIAIQRVASWGGTTLGSAISVTLAAGDQIGLAVSVSGGTATIDAYTATGGVWTNRGSRTDTTYTSARKAAIMASGGTVASLDAYGGGQPSAPTTDRIRPALNVTPDFPFYLEV